MTESMQNTIKAALSEDIGSGDITAKYTLDSNSVTKADFLAKANGILAGVEVIKEVFRQVDSTLEIEVFGEDGSMIKKGDVIASVRGKTKSILTAERTALNFMQRMSGIATLTNQFVQLAKPYKAKILDTRKTAPCLREFDKLAVKIGGGVNHRIGLYDMILIKDNHIAANKSITDVLKKVASQNAEHKYFVEIEVKNLKELEEALAQKPDRIMLDNMSPAEMTEAVKITNGRVPLEASGNVSLDTIEAIAATGVDFISIGALTHSVKALDISLDILLS